MLTFDNANETEIGGHLIPEHVEKQSLITAQ